MKLLATISSAQYLQAGWRAAPTGVEEFHMLQRDPEAADPDGQKVLTSQRPRWAFVTEGRMNPGRRHRAG